LARGNRRRRCPQIRLTSTMRNPHFLSAKALNDHSDPLVGASVSHTTAENVIAERRNISCERNQTREGPFGYETESGPDKRQLGRGDSH
jgi:hypothetical protein